LIGILPDEVAEGVRRGFDDPRRATREEAEAKCRVLLDSARLRASQAMVRSFMPLRDGRADHLEIERIERQYTGITQRCLIVWGRRDAVLPTAMGHKLVNLIPGSTLRIVDNAKHSVPLERPGLAARLIRQFDEQPGRFTAGLQPLETQPRQALQGAVAGAWTGPQPLATRPTPTSAPRRSGNGPARSLPGGVKEIVLRALRDDAGVAGDVHAAGVALCQRPDHARKTVRVGHGRHLRHHVRHLRGEVLVYPLTGVKAVVPVG
jgi:hypothetical protein